MNARSIFLVAIFASFAACNSSNISAGQNATKDGGSGMCTCTDDSASISVASGTGPVIDCASVQADGDPLRPTSGTFEGSLFNPAANANPDASASVGPYTVQVHQLACNLDAGAPCAYLQDEYAFDFAPAAAPSRIVRVYMGQTENIDLLQTQGPNTWRVRNLRSYQTSLSDDAWNFAYFIAWQPTSD